MLHHFHSRRGYSMIGVLITMAIIVVLMAISMTALNDAITGSGNTKSGTAHSMEDKINLSQLYQTFAFSALENNGSLLVPSDLLGGRDHSVNTTANIYSAFIMQNRIGPRMLISANEQSPLVWPDEDYDFTAYRPTDGQFWDPSFSADLQDDSNVSFAHLPIFGKRADKWRRASMNATFPYFGNRGPKDGIDDPNSYTYGRDGSWAAHAVFGDGHVEFLQTFTPGHVTFMRGNSPVADNLYAFDDGEDGGDAILTFTKMVNQREIEVQHD
jgi:Tfp pilus assembly protein PilE